MRNILGTHFGKTILRQLINLAPSPYPYRISLNMPTIKGNVTIRIFDVYGKLVLMQNATAVNTAIDISKLPAGIYLLKTMNNGTEQSVKLVKE